MMAQQYGGVIDDLLTRKQAMNEAYGTISHSPPDGGCNTHPTSLVQVDLGFGKQQPAFKCMGT